MKKIEINKIDVNGKKQGYWDELFIDNIKSKGNYINGKKDGLWVFYDNKNKITSIQSFKNGYSIEAVVDLTALNMSKDIKLESYTDYPESVVNNAKAVLDWVDKNGWGSCGTDVGKQRANQLANNCPCSISKVPS